MAETEGGAGRLIFTGNIVVDIVMRVAAIPEPGGDTFASDARLTAGGGWNTMVAAARDELPVVFAGRYGTGPFGDVIATALVDRREIGGELHAVHPPLPDIDSGFSVALVDDSAERTFVSSVGAEGRLTRDDLDAVTVSPDDLVYVSGYSLAHPSNAAALAGWLASLPAEVRVVFDPSPVVGELAPEALESALARCDLLTVNGREARILTRLDDPATAVRALLKRVRAGGAVVVRVGERGAWICTREQRVEHIPSPRVEAIDTNGAGDAHAGVTAAALARGASLHAAVVRANAAAAIAVTRRGPATAPTTAEIDAALAAADPR